MTSLKDFRDAIGYPQQDNNITDKVLLQGGLNIEENPAAGDPGQLIYCSNYEPNYSGGYRSKAGTEPVAGIPQPSAYVYQFVQMTGVNHANIPSGPPSGNNYIVRIGAGGGGSSPQGYYVGTENVVDSHGNVTLYYVFACLLTSLQTTYYQNTPALSTNAYFIGPIPSGTIIYTFGGVVIGTTSASPVASPDVNRSAFWIASARSVVRYYITQTAPTPGGAFNEHAAGVFDWNGYHFGVYANAVNSGLATIFVHAENVGTASLLLGNLLFFKTNTVQINYNDVITGATSGAQLTVKNVVNMFGTVGAGDAIGYVTGYQIGAPAFSAGEVLKVGGTQVAVAPASGLIYPNLNTSASILPSPGTENYRFRRWNFSGVANDVRLFGVSGVGLAFQLSDLDLVNGRVCLTPLLTGIGLTVATFNTFAASDTPQHIATHKDQLFLGYPGGNLLHSGYQSPTNWTAVKGADDRALGEDITNIVEDINDTLLITTRNRIRMLYGDVNENFQMRDIATTFGALPFTACRIHGCTFMTDEGVMFLDQSMNFGNFDSDSVTQPINSLLKALMKNGAGVLEANVSRDRSMYRVHFDGGICVSICIVGNDFKGIGICNYGQNVKNVWSVASTVPVRNVANSPPPGERIYFRSDDGYIYQDDVGSTFGVNGNAITCAAQTQFFYGQDIGKNKYWRRLYLEILGADALTNLQVGAEYDDGYGYRTPEVLETVTRNLSGSAFDQNSLYGTGFYGGAGRNVIKKSLNNHGCGISTTFLSTSSVAFPHTLQSITLMAAVRARRGWR